MIGMEAPWSVDIETVSKNFDVNPLTGLSKEEVKDRQEKFGLNSFTKSQSESLLKVTVLRESREVEVDSVELVPGDILIFGTSEELSVIHIPNGPIYNIPADARLIEANELEVFETHLTGSSTPSIKDASVATLPEEYSILKSDDIPNMIFSQTQLSKGYGKAIVVATGMNTVISEIMVPLDLPKDLKKKLKKMEKKKKKKN